MWNLITEFGGVLIFVPIGGFYILSGYLNIFYHVLIVLGLARVLGSMIKYVHFKDRPVPMVYKNGFQKIKASSFPSIHTLGACIMFLFALYYLPFYSPLYFINFILVSYSRVVLKKHFYVDLLGGIVLGMFIFIIYLYILNNVTYFNDLNLYLN